MECLSLLKRRCHEHIREDLRPEFSNGLGHQLTHYRIHRRTQNSFRDMAWKQIDPDVATDLSNLLCGRNRSRFFARRGGPQLNHCCWLGPQP
jgi:hypothetical protein